MSPFGTCKSVLQTDSSYLELKRAVLKSECSFLFAVDTDLCLPVARKSIECGRQYAYSDSIRYALNLKKRKLICFHSLVQRFVVHKKVGFAVLFMAITTGHDSADEDGAMTSALSVKRSSSHKIRLCFSVIRLLLWYTGILSVNSKKCLIGTLSGFR